jgi:phosphoribosylamine---glycine ligase
MNILIIGNGGREHALAWKVAQSDTVQRVFVAPGNGGTANETKCQNVALEVTDIASLIDFAQQESIDLTIVGPEVPLSLGIVDQFSAQQLACFGPSQAAAQLESSKAFCKDFMQQQGIPTAAYASFDTVAPALAYLQTQSFPVVIKADGLAAGKGVIIAEDLATAEQTVKSMLDEQQFGEAGAQIVIEAFIQGEELSFIAMVDGEHILPFASSQDHKRLGDNDQGPNTGGMGAYSPAPICTAELQQCIMTTVMQPTVAALKAAGNPYVGFLYAGLMVSESGELNVLEFNCRLGDPETQPLMLRLKSDLVSLCLHALAGTLNQTEIDWSPDTALTVVMAADGYPNHYHKGDTIEGLEQLDSDCIAFHAGTTWVNDSLQNNGGRVLGISAKADNIQTAREKVYNNINKVNWPRGYYRRDIGFRALQYFENKKAKSE